MKERSEPESSAESGPFHVVMDMLLGDWFLDDLADAEGGIARGVKISWRGVQGSLSGSPGLDFLSLCVKMVTILCLSVSFRLTMWPMEGITLMLMDLSG